MLTVRGLVFKVMWVLTVGSAPGCIPFLNPPEVKTPQRDQVNYSDAQKEMMEVVEEETIRIVALERDLHCGNLSSAAQRSESVGHRELVDFLRRECRGEEPHLPKRLPAKCAQQIAVPENVAGLSVVPGMHVEAEDVIRHNLSRCECPPEYKIDVQESEPFCRRNIDVGT